MPDEIPYDTMRRILGLPEPPFNEGGARGGMVSLSRIAHVGAPSFWPGGKLPSWQAALVRQMQIALDVDDVFARLAESIRQLGGSSDLTAEKLREFASALEPERNMPKERALPRPSHTPPPWALNPARTRRTKNGGVDMRTPRV